MKFLHAADLHIGTPLGSLGGTAAIPETDLEELLHEMGAAYDHLIDLAINEQVAFVVFAGDVYDSAEAQDAQQRRFQDGLERLDAAGIPVYIALGNHDPARRFSPRRPYPANVHFFATDTPDDFELVVNGVTVRVAGISFGSRSVPDNLAHRFADLPPAELRIGVLHTSLAGSAEHDTYAPCSVDDLRSAPVDYWALGHIHLRDVNGLGPGRWYAYPGNLQGRSFKPSECHPKGVLIVPFDAHGVGEPEFRTVDTVRFVNLTLDVSDYDQVADLHELVDDLLRTEAANQDNRTLVARVDFVGRNRNEFINDLRREVVSGKFLKDFHTDRHRSGQRRILARITSRVEAALDPERLRQGDDLLALALRALDQWDDTKLTEQLESLLHSKFDVYLERTPEALNAIRQHIELALAEEIQP